jgi:hypothetical protein
VAHSFERGRPTPILGLERDFDRWIAGAGPGYRSQVDAWASPGDRAAATTHGGFDEDPACFDTVLETIARSRTARGPAKRQRRRG